MELPAQCPVCDFDLGAAGWPMQHGTCPVTRTGLEEWVRTGGGFVAKLVQERHDEELDVDLLLLLDDWDD